MELNVKMKFFIIHGSYGNPNENWFPWLKIELEKSGHEVIMPTFPTPEGQSLETWMKVFDEYINQIDSETIFVGHSLGPAFILSVLEKIDIKVRACFFVAGWLTQLNNPDFDEINKTFLEKKFDWTKIKNNCEQFYLFNSDNDPYVPSDNAKKMGLNLNVDIITIPNAGHFNKAAGYTKFKRLLDEINLCLHEEKIRIKNKYDETLVGVYSKSSKDNAKTIILVHGFKVTKFDSYFNELSILLNQENYNIFRFDFSGCGESEGNFEETLVTKLKDDLATILNYVRNREDIDENNISIIAQSFGVAITLALKPNVKSIILTSPAHNFENRWNKLYKFNPKTNKYERFSNTRGSMTLPKEFFEDAESYNLLNNIKEINSPILISYGDKDDKIPVADAEKLFETANNPKELKIFKGADHNHSQCREELFKIILNFLKKY